MKEIRPQKEGQPETGSPWAWVLGAACVVVVLVAFLVPRPGANSPASSTSSKPGSSSVTASSSAERSARAPRHYWTSGVASSAEEIVARKLAQFGKSRRELVHAIAKHFKLDVPTDVERFFAAVEGGNWEEIDAAHNALLLPGEGLNQPRSAELHQIWRAIQETW